MVSVAWDKDRKGANVHHESELSDEIRNLFAALQKGEEERADPPVLELGATGRFPDGQLTPHDEGEIRLAVAVFRGRVIVNFGKPVASLGLTAEQSRSLARVLLRYASKAQGQG